MKFALIGGSLSHSYSEEIHNLFFEYTGIKASYDLIEVPKSAQLAEKIEWFKSSNYRGINVTIPHKENILKYVDNKSDEVQKLGVANTLNFDAGKIHAFNTDYFGFKKTLEMNSVNPFGGKWLVLGYGGGAKSIIAVLEDMGAKIITIANRTKKKAGILSLEEIETLDKYEGVVNTTPVGMFPNTGISPIKPEFLKKFDTAVDIIYNPLNTKFLNDAKQNGLQCVQGLYMLVAQAVKAQEIWQNRTFDDDLISRIYRKVGEGL